MARSPAKSGPTQDAGLQGSYEQILEDAAPPALFGAHGALELYPGAVLLAGHNGIVLHANELATPIATLLTAGGHEELREAVRAAILGTAAQVNPLVVTATEGGKSVERAFDVTVLPWSEGTAALLLGRDVTLERSLRSALVESRQRYKDLVEISNDFAWETDAEGRFAFVSPRGALGYQASELVGRPASDLLLDSKLADRNPFSAKEPVEEAEIWVRDAAGEGLCLLSTVLPLTGHGGAWLGARGVCRDITELRCHEAELAEAQNRERLFSYIVNMVRRELEPQRMLTATAEALLPALALTGISIHALIEGEIGQPLAQAGQAVDTHDLSALSGMLTPEKLTAELERNSGAVLIRATQFRDEMNGLLCVWRASGGRGWNQEDRSLLNNISGQVGLAIEQLARQTEMEVLSMTDPLTGLDNRRSFTAKLEKRVAADSGAKGAGALIYVDLDNFKQVNDTHGHQTGDEALLDVAALLKEQSRSGDLAARLGGDEFALFLEGMDHAEAERKGEQLLKLAERLRGYSGDADHPLGFSLGIAIHEPTKGESLESLLRRADEAMYSAKRSGKNALRLATAYDRRKAAD
ncbi:diguanylate cyclase [Pelagibius sp.]|uniref:GGDEF domain-containing protein n=1 Tax=Pelagibius sp. TaxID=1931238 RepID=UPI00260A8635|nr:diguanylate cyclase [Pelagibius sp.]